MPKPFIYIAALRRSGSNLLCEALTLPPHSYILREPGFARGKFAVKPNDAEYFGQQGIDLREFRARMINAMSSLRRSREKRQAGADLFIDELLPRLQGVSGQIGIKEIAHRNWSRYVERLPGSGPGSGPHPGGVRIILLGRDPRDIYLSLMQKSRERRVNWRGPLTPQSIAESLLRQFEFQRQMSDQAECLAVRYEDFCGDPGVLDRIKEFVGSDLPGVGMIGGLNRHNAAVHAGVIATTSVRRWTREPDRSLRTQALRVHELLAEYNRFWDYAGT